jgi:hypothetical protein
MLHPRSSMTSVGCRHNDILSTFMTCHAFEPALPSIKLERPVVAPKLRLSSFSICDNTTCRLDSGDLKQLLINDIQPLQSNQAARQRKKTQTASNSTLANYQLGVVDRKRLTLRSGCCLIKVISIIHLYVLKSWPSIFQQRKYSCWSVHYCFTRHPHPQINNVRK